MQRQQRFERGWQGHPEGQLLGRLRPRRTEGAVRGGEPERQDQPEHRRVQRPARGPAEEAGRRLRRAGRRGDRRGLHRPVPRPGRTSSSTCWTRAPASTRTSTCRGSGSSRCRPTARPRSASAPTSAAWPCATAPTCSRAAGLPTERDKVSALWPTWDQFIATGQQYVQKTGKKFVDSGTNMFNPVLAQQPQGTSRRAGQADRWRPARRPRSTSRARRSSAGLSANLTASQPEWDSGFEKGKFAVLACPAWMPGHIKNTAPDQKGKWDIAAIPGGGGNWGGSFLTVPKQGKNVDEAVQVRRVAGPAGAADRDLQEGRQPAVAAGAVQGPGGRWTSRRRSSATRRSARSSPTPRRT